MVKKIFNVLIFITILSPFNLYAAATPKEPKTLEEALKVYSTPFIDDYRARYAANNYDKRGVVMNAHATCDDLFHVSYKIPCTKKDVNNIIKLARFGDHAALALASYYPEISGINSEYAAKMGEMDSIVEYGAKVAKTDFDSGKRIFEDALSKGYLPAYDFLAALYYTYGMFDEYCSIMEEGRQKIGFEFIGRKIVPFGLKKYRKKQENPYTKICYNKTLEEYLGEFDTNEAKLFKAYLHLHNEKYEKAKNLFQEIYDDSDNNKTKHNAGFCLGAMYYSGTNTEKDVHYGTKLMKEAVDEGYVVYANVEGLQTLPDKYKILNTFSLMCDMMFLR